MNTFFYISDKNCDLQERSGNYVVSDTDYERFIKTSLENCKSECLNDEKCRATYFVSGFCFIVYKDVPPKLFTDISLYFDKVCTYSKYLDMCS